MQAPLKPQFLKGKLLKLQPYVTKAIFIWKQTSSTLNRDGSSELLKIYDSLLEIPRSRMPSTASSRCESVSQHSGTICWGRRRVSLEKQNKKQKQKTKNKTWVLLNSLKISLMSTTNIYKTFIRDNQSTSFYIALYIMTIKCISNIIMNYVYSRSTTIINTTKQMK